ncbi:MAG: hypothetical protein R2911_35810 [Caldilineaceae bacterium]
MRPNHLLGGEEVLSIDDEQMRISAASGCRFIRAAPLHDRCLQQRPSTPLPS